MRSLFGTLRYPRGLHVDPQVRAEMADQWNRMRMAAAVATMLAGSVVWLLGFDRAWVALVTASLVLLHAIVTRNEPHALTALTIDITLVFLTLEVIDTPTPARSIVYVTYGVITVLLCKSTQRAVLGLLASALFAGGVFFDLPGSQLRPASSWSQIGGWITAIVFVGLLLAVVSLMMDILQRHVEQVRQTNRRLDALVRSKDELISTVSHEIRTPLAGVLGFSTELNDAWETLSPAERRELADLIAFQSQDIAYITEDLLVAARADLGTLNIRLETVDLAQEVGEFLSEYGRASHPIELAGEPCQANVDPVRFRQILRNLVKNAIAHGGERIWLEVAKQPDGGLVRVCDDGEGVPEEKRELVFKPYEGTPQPNPTRVLWSGPQHRFASGPGDGRRPYLSTIVGGHDLRAGAAPHPSIRPRWQPATDLLW